MLALKIILFSCFCVEILTIKIEILGINECDEPVKSEATFTPTLNSDPKSLDLKLHLPEPATEESTFVLKIKQLNEDTGEFEDKEEKKGNVCEWGRQFMPKAMDKLKNEFELKEECYADKGDYTLTKFQVSQGDLIPPFGTFGEFKLDVTFNLSENPAFCFQTHVNVVNE